MRNQHKSVGRFRDDHEVLDFIASRIADAAQKYGSPLSEVERKMLYFSESAWTLPNILEVNDDFERNYDSAAYEKKISRLIKQALSDARKTQKEEFESWDEALAQLSQEDRYLNVMVRQAGFHAGIRSPRRRRKWLKFSVRIAVVVILFGGATWFIAQRFPDVSTGPLGIPRRSYGSALWAVVFCLAILSVLVRVLVGPKKFDKFSARLEGWIFGTSKRAK